MAGNVEVRRKQGALGWFVSQILDAAFVPVVIVLLVIYLSFASPVFLTPGNISNLLAQTVILALVSFGATFVVIGKEIDLSVGAGTAFVSVIAASVMLATGSVALGLLAGIVAGLGVGAVNGFLVSVIEVPSFIATLAILVILRGIALALTSGGVISGLPPELETISEISPLGLPGIVWLMAITFVVLLIIERQTTFGVRVFAVGGNAEAARLSGIRVNRVRFLTYMISGLTMGLAGLALTIRVNSGQPNGGTLLELYAVAAIVMGGTSLGGGRGSVARTLFGVLLIAILQNGLTLASVTYDIQQAVIGTVFILAASVDFVRRIVRRREKTRALESLATGAERAATTGIRAAADGAADQGENGA